MTVFFRLLDVPVDEKQKELRTSISGKAGRTFDVDPMSFSKVPGSVFAYWVGTRMIDLFGSNPKFADIAEAWVGLQTNYDFRWIRCWWEGEADSKRLEIAIPFAKGGIFSPYYADVYLSVRWGEDGRHIKQWKIDQLRQGLITANNSRCWNESHYFRPGLTWPRRTNGLSFRIMPKGCIFADKGPGTFDRSDDHDHILALCAIANSKPFRYLVSIQLARTELAQSFEVGLIERTPVPTLKAADYSSLASLARRAWSLKRRIDTRVETSHAFLLPALLQVEGDATIDRTNAWSDKIRTEEDSLAAICAEVDAVCFGLYGIDESDRCPITQEVRTEREDRPETKTENNIDADADADINLEEDNDFNGSGDAMTLAAELISWAVGVAVGRFDVRLATGARRLPEQPDPFDRLPLCSPAMLTADDGLLTTVVPTGYPIEFPENGFLVDDPGHPRDITAAVQAVLDPIFKERADAWRADVDALLDPKGHDLRAWLAGSYFVHHLKRHSKSRRKAPIIWQFAVPSGRYSVWLYAHRAGRDSFIQIQNDIVTPKLVDEERRLAILIQSAGANPTSEESKKIETQQAFVGELRDLLDKVKRVAPLWRPTLDDGVVLTMALLWQLVPQHKSWQRELKSRWDELAGGEYDWAHIAMHLWPERVVPKCAEDRSLAIAHGLEDILWFEDADGKWKPHEESHKPIAKLISERTSTAVKAALKNLRDASEPASIAKRSRKSNAA